MDLAGIMEGLTNLLVGFLTSINNLLGGILGFFGLNWD